MGQFRGQAQIKESTELASHTQQIFVKETLWKKKIIKYVKMAGFWAIGGSSRPNIDEIIILISGPPYSLKKTSYSP